MAYLQMTEHLKALKKDLFDVSDDELLDGVDEGDIEGLVDGIFADDGTLEGVEEGFRDGLLEGEVDGLGNGLLAVEGVAGPDIGFVAGDGDALGDELLPDDGTDDGPDAVEVSISGHSSEHSRA